MLSDVSDVSCLEDDIIDNVTGVQCTCGAEGRAYKKGCPMNSRNRYPTARGARGADLSKRGHQFGQRHAGLSWECIKLHLPNKEITIHRQCQRPMPQDCEVPT